MVVVVVPDYDGGLVMYFDVIDTSQYVLIYVDVDVCNVHTPSLDDAAIEMVRIRQSNQTERVYFPPKTHGGSE